MNVKKNSEKIWRIFFVINTIWVMILFHGGLWYVKPNWFRFLLMPIIALPSVFYYTIYVMDKKFDIGALVETVFALTIMSMLLAIFLYLGIGSLLELSGIITSD